MPDLLGGTDPSAGQSVEGGCDRRGRSRFLRAVELSDLLADSTDAPREASWPTHVCNPGNGSNAERLNEQVFGVTPSASLQVTGAGLVPATGQRSWDARNVWSNTSPPIGSVQLTRRFLIYDAAVYPLDVGQ